MFVPVELVHPGTGQRHVARSAIDLNDRLAEGYTRPLPQLPAIPTTSPYKVTSWKSAPVSDEVSDTDSDLDSF